MLLEASVTFENTFESDCPWCHKPSRYEQPSQRSGPDGSNFAYALNIFVTGKWSSERFSPPKNVFIAKIYLFFC